MIVKLVAHLRRIPRNVDVKVGKVCAFARQMLERTVIALDQSGRVHAEQVAKHEAVFDEAVHVFFPDNFNLRKSLQL